MKKKMNLVELTRKQQAVIKAGEGTFDCMSLPITCRCAVGIGYCDQELLGGEGDGGCMSPA